MLQNNKTDMVISNYLEKAEKGRRKNEIETKIKIEC